MRVMGMMAGVEGGGKVGGEVGVGWGNHREVMDDQGSQAIGSQPVWIPHPPPVQVQV